MDSSFSLAAAADVALFAESNLIDALGSGFRGDGGSFVGTATTWGALLSALGAVWWASAIMLRKRSERKVDSPRRLFRELCRAHRLAWREVATLHEVAELHGLDTPLECFVRDDLLDLDDAAGTETLRGEAARIRKKLFAVDEHQSRDERREKTAAAI